MTTPTPQEQRAEFEAWHRATQGSPLTLDANGDYGNMFAAERWEAWQAAQAPLLERLRAAEAEAARKTDAECVAEFSEFLRMTGEAKRLSPILAGMVEGGAVPENPQDIYTDNFSPPDGDVYVIRASELLIEQADEIKRLYDLTIRGCK